jgi:pimeloyl-ACP methyl ester carboxylesterase
VPSDSVVPATAYRGTLPPLDETVDLAAPPGTRIRLGGSRSINVRRLPAGPGTEPAVYVHGMFSDSTYWTEFGHLASDHLDGHAIDLPGFGRSSPAPGNRHSLAAHVAAVRQYLLSSGRGAVHLAGNSLGGVVCLLLAARWPELVRTLTLISPAIAMPSVRPRTAVFASLPMLPPAMSPAQELRAGQRFVFGSPSRLTPARRRRFETVFAEQRSMRTRSAGLQSLASLGGEYLRRGGTRLWERAADVPVPTLVVWGGQDRIMPVALAPRLAATIPDARLLVLDDVGHLPYVEAPEPVARAVLGLVVQRGGPAQQAAADRPRPDTRA